MTKEEAIWILENRTVTGELKPRVGGYTDLYDFCLEALNLPSAQPLRMKGKWIDITKTGGDELWKCSECGELELEDSYYCPNCGADMRGDTDEV